MDIRFCIYVLLVQESIPVQFETSSDTDDLLAALQVKAAAFSNDGWNTYWGKNGPQFLIDAWKLAHPELSLSRVARVCSVDFISSFLSESEPIVHDTPHSEMMNTLSPQQDASKTDNKDLDTIETNIEVDKIFDGNEMADNLKKLELSDTNTDQDTMEETGVKATSSNAEQAQCTDISNEDLVTLWGDHYNTCYWYCFQSYSQEQLLTSAGEEVSIRRTSPLPLPN